MASTGSECKDEGPRSLLTQEPVARFVVVGVVVGEIGLSDHLPNHPIAPVIGIAHAHADEDPAVAEPTIKEGEGSAMSAEAALMGLQRGFGTGLTP